MAFIAYLLAAIQFALVALGVDFPQNNPLENIAVGLFLVTLGLLLPGAVTFVNGRRS